MRIPVALPAGEVTVSAALDAPASPRAALALAHGSGGSLDSPFLIGFAQALRDAGVATLRFNLPYREAGRRMPGPAAHAIAAWAAVLPALEGAWPGLPRVAAGKSYGGRMASMAAADGVISPDALVYLGYPLHPPGRPDAPRAEHLPRIAVPQLFVEGTTDPFIQPIDRFEAAVATCQDAETIWFPGAGHSFDVAGARTAPEAIGAGVAALVLPWLDAHAAGVVRT